MMETTDHVINMCKSSDALGVAEYPIVKFISYNKSTETYLTAHDGTPVIAVWWSANGAWDVWYDNRSQ